MDKKLIRDLVQWDVFENKSHMRFVYLGSGKYCGLFTSWSVAQFQKEELDNKVDIIGRLILNTDDEKFNTFTNGRCFEFFELLTNKIETLCPDNNLNDKSDAFDYLTILTNRYEELKQIKE